MKKVRGYGSWKSPISAKEVASESLGLSEIEVSNKYTYWLETRPSEEGRTVVVRQDPDGSKSDLIPEGYNARTRVHEYGGKPYLIGEGEVFFVNFEDQRLYKNREDDLEPVPVTPEENKRYADFSLDKKRELLWAVCEDHTGKSQYPKNCLVKITLGNTREPQVVVWGSDFYSSPRPSPDGSTLAWITWDHPSMPWDETQLHLGKLNSEGEIENSRIIRGSDGLSVVQPRWGPDGKLYFISDRTGWWNIYCWDKGEVEPVIEVEAEFARPQWQFGASTYDFPNSDDLVFTFNQNGRWFLGRTDRRSPNLEPINLPFTQISSVKAEGEEIWFIAGGPHHPRGIRKYQPRNGSFETFQLSTTLDVDEGFVSPARTVNFNTGGNSKKAQGFFYPPCSFDFEGPEDEKPPLLVISHGGPTSSTSDMLKPEIQFWTTRGFAVLDVNYRGSSGFGREYRDALKGQWGLVDVEDCASGALYLVEDGEVDGERLLIRGGSAGGYTTLAALTFEDVFDAGASYYGVSDPAALAKETHKFESRYLDSLIGPYPEEKELYENRSPIEHQDQLSCPVVFFQGEEDRVVPPDQAKEMYQSLKERGIPTAYLLFEGEQHGFRKEGNIRRALEAELFFYSRVLGFELGEDVSPLEIDNLN
ncbi:S9 family peptidase [Candidatus Bipolaricaulota bacterium]|nr:S9 family peptidase [Candidatus Bipolaricaulota bacterium]